MAWWKMSRKKPRADSSFRIADRLDFIDARANAPFELVGELLDKV